MTFRTLGRASGLVMVLCAVWAAGPLSSRADYVPISLSPVANNVGTNIQNQPEGQVVLGGIPFDILPSSQNNQWYAAVGTTLGVRSTQTMALPANITGATTVYTLINTAWGVPGAMTDSLTFVCSDGFSYTTNLTEGTDLRDWLYNTGTPYCNTINGTSTVQVFAGPSYYDGAPEGHMDMQTIPLPGGFASRTLVQIILTDGGVTGNEDAVYGHQIGAQRAFIYGATAAVIPEPASLSLLMAGGLILLRRKLGRT
jgi:hypothetical protein